MLLRIMKNNLLFSIGIIVCALWILIAIVTVLVPSITPYSYLAQDSSAEQCTLVWY